MDEDDAHRLAIVQAQPGIEARSPGAALAAIFAAQLKHYTLAPEFVVGLTRFAGQPVYARRVQNPIRTVTGTFARAVNGATPDIESESCPSECPLR